jgi:hypothetical protein
MRSRPFWVVAALTWLTWLAAAAHFWNSYELPMPPSAMVQVVALFYVPLLWLGPWAARTGTLSSWTGGRIVGSSLLGVLAFLPWGVLTLPLLPLTTGALLASIGVLVWGWRHQRVHGQPPGAYPRAA